MRTDVIVNPLAAVETVDDSEELISSGPVPGRGMRFLRVSPNDRPHLHALFSELRSVGINMLDPVNDLDREEIILLEDHGILISPDNVPERPLFSCMLEDVETTSKMPADLIVSPTLEFQPFVLSEFRSLMQKHLSPHHARVWVNDPMTGVRLCYWLSPNEAEVVESLKPGCSAGEDLDDISTQKFLTAGILIEAGCGLGHGEDYLSTAAHDFAAKRYAIIDRVVPPAQLRALQSYFRRYLEQGFMKFGDDQVPLRFTAHSEHVAEMVHIALTQVMAKLTGIPVVPTYSYAAAYVEGAVLEPHVDHHACEFSFSFQLEYLPAPSDGVSPWPLYVSSNEPEDLDVHPDNDTAVHLANGSMLAYKGRELVHYRTPLFPGHRSSSLFFHYVPA